MEKSLSIQEEAVPESKDLQLLIAQAFNLPVKDWKLYSPLTLAYIGDGVYDLIIRTVLVRRANIQTSKLHRQTTELVKAPAQAKIAKLLYNELTEEEQAVWRRGRNAHPAHSAKNSSHREYLEATGFEALIGFLYLCGSYDRILTLIRLGLDKMEIRI